MLIATAPLLALTLMLGAAPEPEVSDAEQSASEVYAITRALTAGLIAEREAMEKAELEAAQEPPAWMRVRAKSNALEITAAGLLLVGGVTWAIGQIELDSLKSDPPGPARDAREGTAYTLNVGGLGTVIAGAALWFISVEIANWAPDAPVSAAITPTDGGAELRLGMRFP